MYKDKNGIYQRGWYQFCPIVSVKLLLIGDSFCSLVLLHLGLGQDMRGMGEGGDAGADRDVGRRR
jgi:hypothetical protein